MVYARLAPSAVLSIGVGLAFTVLLAPYLGMQGLVQWLGIIVAVNVPRLILAAAWRRASPQPQHTHRWRRLFMSATLASALAWSAGPVLLMAPGQSANAVLVAAVLCITIVGVSTFSAMFTAQLLFLAGVMLPMAGSLVQVGGGLEQVLALALATLTFVMLAIGWETSRSTLRLLRTEIELSRAAHEAAHARQAAEASNAAKTRFLANMSHEVRTPLNGILGLADLLARAPIGAEPQRQVGLVRTSAEHLLHIVNELLDFSKIEAGRMELSQADLDLHDVLEQTVAIVAPTAQAAGLRLELQVGDELPRWVRSDALRLRQILLNLLTNAIKFTEQGRVTVRAGLAQGTAPQGSHWLLVDVADTGIGIAPEDQARVFEAFSQADDSATRRFGGTGLGLTVCRQLAELMGGSIHCESMLGAGTTFRVLLRLEAATAPATATAPMPLQEPAHASPRPAGQKVLLVEDVALNREVAIAMLEGLGFEVDWAGDGLAALEQAQSGRYDLVLMDCQMPRMDGFDAAAALRSRATLARNGQPVPIVALTASAFEADRQRAMAVGMNDYLAKPIRANSLAAMVQRVLGEAIPA